MTNKEFVEKLKDIAADYKTVYMWGVFGAPVTEKVISDKTAQYPSWYTAAKQALFRSLIGKGYFAFDCVNLLKAILWGWNGDSSKSYGGAKYASNGVPDVNADGMIAKCLRVTTDFSNVEVGEALWMSGHIGVYIGDGLAVECTPAWENKVQITAVGNIGKKKGYNTRTWTKHGHIPYITYEKIKPEQPAEAEKESEVESMTKDEFRKLFKEILAEGKGDHPSDWAKEACEANKAAGIFKGDGNGNYNWQDPISREAVAVLLKNAGVI